MSRNKSFGFSVAIIVLASVAVSCGRSASYYVNLGNEHSAKREYSDALLSYRKAIQKDPQFGEARYQLGRALVRSGQFSEAYQNLQSAEQLLSGREDVRVELGNLLLTSYLSSPSHPQQLYDQLTSISARLLALNPNSVDGLRFQGELALTDRKFHEAAALFQRANAIRPMDPAVVGPWVESLLKDGQFPEGEKLAWQLIQARKDFSLIYEVLYAHYMAQKRYAEGETVLRTRIQNSPGNVNAVLQLGFHYDHLQQRALMLSTLQRILDAPKTYSQGHLHVGEFYAALQKPEEAMREFRDGLKAEPKAKSVYLSKIAGVQIAQGKADEAAQTVEEILKDKPKDRDARAMRAILLLDSGRPEKLDLAAAELQDLIKLNPEDATLRFSMGRAQMSKANLDAAKTEFQETIRIRANDVPARLALVQISAKNNAYADVLRYAGEILALDPNNRPARLWNAVGLMGRGSYVQARTELTRFLRDYPDSVDAQLQLGLLAVNEKKFKEAEVIFRKYYQPNSADARPLEGIVRMYVAEKDLDKALQTAQAEVNRSPTSKPARSVLAAVASAAGKPNLAVEQYQWLVSRNPKDFDYQIKLAQSYQANSDMDRALESFRKAQALAPNDGRVVAAVAYLLDAGGQRGAAKANYQRALQLDPNNPLILNNLAYLLADNRDNLDEALRLVNEAQRKLPDDPGLADTLAWIYVQKNLNEGAIQILARLVREHPNDPGYRYHLAVACLQSGDKKRAKRELETALSNRPAKDTADRIRALIAKID